MSRAFVSQEANEAAAAAVPERPISLGPNLVTPQGLSHIDSEISRLAKMLAAAPPDDPERPKLARDLRYWRSRHLSAQVVLAPPGSPSEVAFGTRVTIRRGSTEESYRIVGEDEADPRKGLLSWSSPLAKTLIGAAPGDDVDIGGGRPVIRVVRVERA